MTRTVIARVHHDKALGEIVFLAKVLATEFVKADGVVVRPGRQDRNALFGNPIRKHALLHETIQNNHPMSVAHAVTEKAAEHSRSQRLFFEPASSYRLVRVEVHYPEEQQPSFEP